MTLIPARFLLRVAHPCPHVADMPAGGDGDLIVLPEAARLDHLPDLDDGPRFADVRLGWNAAGLGLWAEVTGKRQPLLGDVERPRASDGLTLWLDTRGDRTFHRAGRTCHQFHFLPSGGGAKKDEPTFIQAKIGRATADAPLSPASEVPYRCTRLKGGYRIEAFLSAAVLSGFDPETNPRLGVYYAVRDFELGEQTLGVGQEFPFAEDPSLWAALELRPPAG